MQYNYRARNRRGEILSGVVEAPTLEAAEKTLHSNGLKVMHLETPRTFLEVMGFGHKVRLKSKAFFTEQLATMVNAGLPLVQVLSLLARSERNTTLKRVVISVKEDLEAGYSFSTSIAKYPEMFSRVFVNAVRAGEATGKLELVLKELADTLERENRTAASFRSMMIYPIFIISAMIIVGGIMMVKVIPVLSAVFLEADAELPLMTRLLIAVSNFLAAYWWIAIVAAIGLYIGLRAFLRTSQGRYFLDSLRLRLPVVRDLNKSFLMARFTRTLGMLVTAGVPLLEAIQITADAMGHVIYKEDLERVAVQLERGVTLSVSISKSSYFPPLVAQMILVGEQTGELDKVLSKLSFTYEEEYDALAKGSSALIEPIVIVILGLGVAFLLFAILIPIYQVSLLQS